MCGIVGIIGVNNVDANDLLKFISHRGPDSSGIFKEKEIFLGHTRLSILDLSDLGKQPMFSEDRKYVLVFNGEIYNHLNIRESLPIKYQFKSTSDTETLLYALIEYGTEVLSKLNGIFTFAFYNLQSEELLIVRDQFGIKPLYYTTSSGVFAFSSEMKALLRIPGIDTSIDINALQNYIQMLWSAGEKTPLKNTFKLQAGHYIRLNIRNTSNFEIKKYYEIPLNGKYLEKTEGELLIELEIKLEKAVERQLMSDVPIGFFLSGGLDSSAIVAIARKLRPHQKLQCYTIDSGAESRVVDGFTDDLPFAKLVAKYLNVELVIVKADIDIVRDFDKMIYHLDEPQADPAPLNVLNICRKAKEDGYKVLLGGTAGDDLFSGYRRHQALSYEKWLNNRILRNIFAQLLKLINIIPSKKPIIRRLKKILNDVNKPQLIRLSNYFLWLSNQETNKLFSDNYKEKVHSFSPTDLLIEALRKIPYEKNLLNKMLFWEMKYFLTDHNLNYTDKMSMAVGVEVRVPFLDVELVEFSTRIPPGLKMKGTTTKYLFKKVMEKYLPKEIIYRPKTGFGAPIREWVTNNLNEKISDYLGRESIEKRGIFNYDAVQNLIIKNKKGAIDASYSIWALLAIESWMRQFIDTKIHETNNTKS